MKLKLKNDTLEYQRTYSGFVLETNYISCGKNCSRNTQYVYVIINRQDSPTVCPVGNYEFTRTKISSITLPITNNVLEIIMPDT